MARLDGANAGIPAIIPENLVHLTWRAEVVRTDGGVYEEDINEITSQIANKSWEIYGMHKTLSIALITYDQGGVIVSAPTFVHDIFCC